ncbi:MAG: PepSY domain-containing protein [bacterium]|nr:PepSY domain-containing protein [bacterium]
MKRRDINKHINEAFDKITPANYNKVISKLENKKGVILEMEKSQEKKHNLFYKYAMCAMIVVFIGIISTYFINTKTVYSSLTIDVNPSIKLSVNKNKKIVNAEALNNEGVIILDNMELSGSSLDVATNAIIGSMLRNGYISELKNSILLTVDGKNAEFNETIKQELSNKIDEFLSAYKLDGSVISQTIESNNEIDNIANTYNISTGKAKLINDICKSNNLYSLEELAKLSINELNLLASSAKNNVTTVDINGTASDKSYIGSETAKEIVAKKIGTEVNSITSWEVELDFDNGIMVYEVECYYNNIEYDYELNAQTGEIIKYDDDLIEIDNSISSSPNNPEIDNSPASETDNNYISKEKVKEIVFSDAKVTTVTDLEIDFEYKAGVAIYEVDFDVNDIEYNYELNAQTGEIIKKKEEKD